MEIPFNLMQLVSAMQVKSVQTEFLQADSGTAASVRKLNMNKMHAALCMMASAAATIGTIIYLARLL